MPSRLRPQPNWKTDSRGLDGLTIANVAAEAGVTRQLVYGHFDDANAHLLALLKDRFGADRADPGQAPAGERPPGLARSLALRVMSRPAADRRLLRSVLAASDERRPELTRLIAALRAAIIDRWIRLAPDGKTDAAARAWVGAVFNAQFGLWDLVDGGKSTPGRPPASSSDSSPSTSPPHPATASQRTSAPTLLASPISHKIHRLDSDLGTETDGRPAALSGRVVGTYLHGPALVRNPGLADLLLSWVTGPLPPIDPRQEELVQDLRRERLATSAAPG